MGKWLIVVNEQDEYAEHGNLYASIVERTNPPGRVKGPAGWAGIRLVGRLSPGLRLREPQNTEERRAVTQTKTSSDYSLGRGKILSGSHYAAAVSWGK